MTNEEILSAILVKVCAADKEFEAIMTIRGRYTIEKTVKSILELDEPSLYPMLL